MYTGIRTGSRGEAPVGPTWKTPEAGDFCLWDKFFGSV